MRSTSAPSKPSTTSEAEREPPSFIPTVQSLRCLSSTFYGIGTPTASKVIFFHPFLTFHHIGHQSHYFASDISIMSASHDLKPATCPGFWLSCEPISYSDHLQSYFPSSP